MKTQHKTILQNLKKEEKDAFSLAFRYFVIISAFNNLELTDREIQLLAFMAIRGSVSHISMKKEFCALYDSSVPTVNNMLFKMRKRGILTEDKESGKTRINSQISLPFDKMDGVILNIKIKIEGGEEDSNV